MGKSWDKWGDTLFWRGGDGDEGSLGGSLPSFDISSFCYCYRENEYVRVLRICEFKLGTTAICFCVNVGM